MYDINDHRKVIEARHRKLFDLLRDDLLKPNRIAADEAPEQTVAVPAMGDQSKFGGVQSDSESVRRFLSDAIASLRKD